MLGNSEEIDKVYLFHRKGSKMLGGAQYAIESCIGEEMTSLWPEWGLAGCTKLVMEAYISLSRALR